MGWISLNFVNKNSFPCAESIVIAKSSGSFAPKVFHESQIIDYTRVYQIISDPWILARFQYLDLAVNDPAPLFIRVNIRRDDVYNCRPVEVTVKLEMVYGECCQYLRRWKDMEPEEPECSHQFPRYCLGQRLYSTGQWCSYTDFLQAPCAGVVHAPVASF